MGFALLPFAAILLMLGLAMQGAQLADTVPGAGLAGRSATLALVSAQQAEMFATSCASTAGVQTGVVSASLAVALPVGVALPRGAVCMTVANGSGRDIYAYLPSVAGEAGQIVIDTMGSGSWFQIRSGGIASNLITGENAAVPLSIPVGSILDWVQTSS